jgi:predicted nuclease of predicted toxin-antitoxin system
LKILIDECLHISLVPFARDHGHEAYHVTWLGLAGTMDWKLMPRIIEGDFTFVTNDARDFRRLYSETALHAGLIILLPQLPAIQQLVLFEAALRELSADEQPPVNEVIEVTLVRGEAIIDRYPLPR